MVLNSTSGFSSPIQKQGNVFQQSNSPFGIWTSSGSQAKTTIESSVTKQSRAPSYAATRDKSSGEIMHSISAMPAYIDKSHEELRLETQESNKEGDPKTCPTPNIFTSPSIFNSSFQPFTSNFPPSNTTISTTSTLSPFSHTNLHPSIPSPTFTQTRNPFSLTPSHKSILVNSDQCPTTPMTPYVRNFSPSVTLSQSTQSFSYQPFKSNLSAPKIDNFVTTTNNPISTAVNPFSHINLYPSQPQTSIPQPTPVSSSLNLSFLNHCPNTTPSTQSTSVTPLDSWPFTPRTLKLGQTAEKVDSIWINDQSQQSQASSGFTKMVEISGQTMNGQQQYVLSSLVENPFSPGSPIVRPNAVTSRHGISSLPVSNNLATNRRTTSLLRIRHVASRHPWLPSQKPSCETKVPFFIDEVDKPGPSAPFLPRENPRSWIKNSLSLHSHSNSKGHEDNENSPGITGDTSIQEDDVSTTLSQHQELNDTAAEKHKADILATMPKLPEGGGYYTEPCVTELAAKEIGEPGWCTRVNSFAVGRKGYGSIKLLGETDVRNLHLESIVHFNDREVIVYPDEEKKPPIGQSLNKPCEVTLLNVKCMDKKAGKQYVEGPKVDRFKEMLMNKCSEQGAEFVSYDPVHGEWKFRVQHF